MTYIPSKERYGAMQYRRCGASGLLLPAVSLGLWHNFGDDDDKTNSRNMIFTAFDAGITHFDLANNYGPQPGGAERTFGEIIHSHLAAYRDQMIISTKAGYTMWEGPYGDWGSRKYLLSSLDQSLRRMKLDYVDIFYHHRPDPNTPLYETMCALDQTVRQGKALYVGLSNYSPEQLTEALNILDSLGTPCLIEQSKYSMFVRTPEQGLLGVAGKRGVGFIAFSPLAQGLLTDRYLHGIPQESRAARNQFLKEHDLSPEVIDKVSRLNDIAILCGLTMAQLAVKWLLRDQRVASVVIGASRPQQISDIVSGVDSKELSAEVLKAIEKILA